MTSEEPGVAMPELCYLGSQAIGSGDVLEAAVHITSISVLLDSAAQAKEAGKSTVLSSIHCRVKCARLSRNMAKMLRPSASWETY